MSDTIEIPTTEVPTTEVPTTQEAPEYLFDVDALVSEHDLLLKKEAEDRALANTVEFPDTVAFKAKLVEWASKGFPEAYPVFSVTLNPPAVCSDGVVRNIGEYFLFLTGSSVGDKLQLLTHKLKGMHMGYSNTDNEFTFRVYKD